MRSLLPRLTTLSIVGTDATLEDEPEIQGRAIIFSWFGLVVEISIGRHT